MQKVERKEVKKFTQENNKLIQVPTVAVAKRLQPIIITQQIQPLKRAGNLQKPSLIPKPFIKRIGKIDIDNLKLKVVAGVIKSTYEICEVSNEVVYTLYDTVTHLFKSIIGIIKEVLFKNSNYEQNPEEYYKNTIIDNSLKPGDLIRRVGGRVYIVKDIIRTNSGSNTLVKYETLNKKLKSERELRILAEPIEGACSNDPIEQTHKYIKIMTA